MPDLNVRLGERVSVNLVETDEDTPSIINIGQYVQARVNCLFDYHDDPRYAAATKECSIYLSKTPTQQVINRACDGDPRARVEIAIRYLSQCGMGKLSPEGALVYLDPDLDSHENGKPWFGNPTLVAIKAQGHSCATQAYLLKVLATPSERADIAGEERRWGRPASRLAPIDAPSARITNFTHALHHANESARLGLVSPAVLHAGFLLREFGDTAGLDVSQITRSRRFSALWRAVTRRLDELYAEERLKQRKLAKDPNAYVCGAEGCPMRAEERAAFRKCAGPCPADLKPHYCSAACQKKDWLRHKALCKPGSKGWVPGVTHQPRATALNLLGIEPPANDAAAGCCGRADSSRADTSESERPVLKVPPPGPARTGDIPVSGTSRGYISVTSDTLEVEMMKYIREEAMRQMRNGDGGMFRAYY